MSDWSEKIPVKVVFSSNTTIQSGTPIWPMEVVAMRCQENGSRECIRFILSVNLSRQGREGRKVPVLI